MRSPAGSGIGGGAWLFLDGVEEVVDEPGRVPVVIGVRRTIKLIDIVVERRSCPG